MNSYQNGVKPTDALVQRFQSHWEWSIWYKTISLINIKGYVFKAHDCATNQPVAIKRSQKVGNKVSREYEVLTALKGKPNVIQLLNFFYSLDSKNRLIQNSVFEFCDKNLEDVLKELDDRKCYLAVGEIKRFIKEILNGLAHMHQQKIVHRDLKPENILLKNNQVKICDFGSSKFLDEKEFKNTPYVVSRYYRAPELILASNKYNETIDIWGKYTFKIILVAVGCILFEMMSKTPLFPGDTEGLQILEQICIVGSPSDEDMAKLAKICDETVMKVLKRATFLKRLDITTLLSP